MRVRVGVVVLMFLLMAGLAKPVMALDEAALNRVAAKMSKVAGRTFKVEVVPDEDLNAQTDADGNIQVTSAMANSLKTPDEAAGLLGHEMAHVTLRHHGGQMESSLLGALGGLLVAKATGVDPQLGVEIGAGIVGGKHSRKDEYRADAEGAKLAQRAGYNPQGLVSVLKRLQGRYGDGSAHTPVIGWFASHPDTGERIKRLNGEIKQFADTEQASGSVGAGQTVVVALDPKASESYGLLFGSGYYYAEDLSRVALQEAEIALERKGYQVLVAAQDVGPLQEELDLESSEWGNRGQNRNPKGYFEGAHVMFYVSVYIQQQSGFAIGDWEKQAQLSGLKLGVLLREISISTRKQTQSYRGKGSARSLDRVDATWRGYQFDFQWATNQGRIAIQGALSDALGGVRSYVAPTKMAPPASKPQSAVRFADVGEEVRLDQPISLTVSVPQGTTQVVFRVFDANGQQVLDGADSIPPMFSVQVRPGMLKGLDQPFRLEAIASSREGRELGRASVRLVLAQ